MPTNKKIKFISNETVLLTWLIVETALEKAKIQPTKELVEWFVAKANYHFNESKVFRKSILSKKNGGNAGRDNLYLYVYTWIRLRFWDGKQMPVEYLPYMEKVPDYPNTIQKQLAEIEEIEEEERRRKKFMKENDIINPDNF